MTTASQPGRPFAPGHDGRARAQRAFVSGFAEPATGARLAAAAAREGLWSWSEPAAGAAAPDRCALPPQPVGLADGRPYLFAGGAAADLELELFEEHVSPEALAALRRTELVWLADPRWGRREALWRALDAALA